MSNHQLITSEISITDLELLSNEMTEQELDTYIKNELAKGLVDELLKHNTIKLIKTKDDVKKVCKFKLLSVSINYDSYIELYDAIFRNDFKIMKNDEVVPLINLL